MGEAFLALLRSRKAFVGATCVLGVVFVSLTGLLCHVPVEALIALIASITATSWKIIEGIATEDAARSSKDADH